MSKRIPFHVGMFYAAMCYGAGRVPDEKIVSGFSGIYDFTYYPTNKDEGEQFEKLTSTLREWLDHFEVIFSGTQVEYHKSAGVKKDALALHITISHKVKKLKPTKAV